MKVRVSLTSVPFLTALAGCLPLALLPAPLSAQTVNDPALLVENVIGTGGLLDNPTAMVFLSTHDILVAQKDNGQVRRIINGVLQPAPVLDLAVNANAERGLLGLALDPQFATNSLVHVFYTRPSTGGDTTVESSVIDNRISRFTWNGTALVNEQLTLTLPVSPGPNHVGGTLAFGPPNAPPAEQKLFAVIGDLNRNNQTQNWANGAPPDDSSSIIRINPNGTVPTGTDRGPFFDVAGSNAPLQRLYAYGIRNSFGIAFDTHPTLGGALWDTENGTNSWDEVNRVDPAFNSGWEDQQGPTGFPGVDQPAPGRVTFGGRGTYSEPEFSWRQSVAPTALNFFNSNSLGPAYQHDCFVASLGAGKIYRFELNASRTAFVLPGNLADTVLDTSLGDTDSPIAFGNGFSVPTDLKTGPDGNLYVLSFGNGQIYRIRHRNAPVSFINPVQKIQIASFGTFYQELYFNYVTRNTVIYPVFDTTQRLNYTLPKGQFIGIFHYDYAAGRYTQAVYQLNSNL